MSDNAVTIYQTVFYAIKRLIFTEVGFGAFYPKARVTMEKKKKFGRDGKKTKSNFFFYFISFFSFYFTDFLSLSKPHII